MSNPNPMHDRSGATPAKPRRHIIISIIMVFFGIILLAPGVCALFFVALGGGLHGDGAIIVLWLFCFAVSAAGVALIVNAFR